MQTKLNLLTKHSNTLIEAGCDEVGRGCLAGPVVAAAVIIDKTFNQNFINDSKKLTFKQRMSLDDYIKNNVKEYAIAQLPPKYIDQHNILQASIDAMHLALDQLSNRPEFVIVDGNKFKPYQDIPHECIIKGDSQYLSIAAASILAKNYRDRLMIDLAKQYPEYGWESNFGYCTKVHQRALMEYGPTEHHRQSFRLIYDI